ncbi:hypothetical protein DAI22_01g130400 [Oryza sativa Japonica Group]|nr:hypothetical protein DAI22_01g130400 [Oryza sativa Japonica Group]
MSIPCRESALLESQWITSYLEKALHQSSRGGN